MSGWWMADLWQTQHGPVRVVSWTIWVLGSIVLHELAHGWAAIRCGDQTPRYTNHMTWNPLVHMGQWSLVMFALVGIAWGAMPIDPTRMRGRHAEALVSVAGPAMNLSLALLALIASVVWAALAGGHWFASVQAADTLYINMQIFLFTGIWLNLLLMAFNLMPIPPLDGSRILGHYWRPYNQFFSTENGQWVGLGLFILLFWVGGRELFPFAREAAQIGHDAILGLVAPGAV